MIDLPPQLVRLKSCKARVVYWTDAKHIEHFPGILGPWIVSDNPKTHPPVRVA